MSLRTKLSENPFLTFFVECLFSGLGIAFLGIAIYEAMHFSSWLPIVVGFLLIIALQFLWASWWRQSRKKGDSKKGDVPNSEKTQ